MSLVTETVQSGWRRRPAFTLPELVVVTAIILLLASLLMTGLRRVKRQADSRSRLSDYVTTRREQKESQLPDPAPEKFENFSRPGPFRQRSDIRKRA